MTDQSALARQMVRLGNEALVLAAKIAGDGLSERNGTNVPPFRLDDEAYLLAAEKLYSDRMRRKEAFSADLFGEPAWDILLDLYIAEKRDRQVSITDACLASGMAQATALRWLKNLERHGLVERRNDQRDARRIFVLLTKTGHQEMTRFFEMTSGRSQRTRQIGGRKPVLVAG